MDFLFESCEHAPSFANERVVFPPCGNKNFEQFEIGLRSLRFRKDDFTGMGIPSGSVIVSRAPGLLGLVIVPFGFMVMAVVIAVFRFGRMSVPGRSGARRPVPATRHQGYGQYAC